ncbi:hypothetical protein FOXG_17797 [Fusarium oxysporum f. sp. lycopersici 4287]|uniref:Uncharacterized protein n=1 Tax=Fusarium oxysporum f. sp. lycopersici (strain 4287 / CBS 123668 / FGSC 9935 / NRRL 34936) TaxID=426428 RepID=A0A0J9U413_FUSO4|nr:hypothetical protein FOXG_17797 [Fusarium oxysporum f. sp. lycopersici 4287]KNA93627.1 hypothetical protein FOXG_17797 [Fusarium oxysporum f. sp. lycopersici 4287]
MNHKTRARTLILTLMPDWRAQDSNVEFAVCDRCFGQSTRRRGVLLEGVAGR